jgi:hypothetical protein
MRAFATPRGTAHIPGMRIAGIFALALAVAALWGAAPARAEEGELRASRPDIRREVIAVIDGQLAAFRAHDLGSAYSFAAVALRQQFPVSRFAETVRRGYPEIWANARAEYGIVRDNGVRAMLNVRVFQANNASASYDYILFKEPSGWRIGGVSVHAEPPATAAGSA